MKLQTKFALYLAGILTLMGSALVLNGYWIINKIIFTQYENQFARELQNLVVEVQRSYDTLEKAGILDLDAYVKSSQNQLINKFQDYHFGQTGYLYIFDKDARVVYHPNANSGHSAYLGIEDTLLNSESGSIEFNYHEHPEFGVFQKSGVWDWTILLAIQQDEMFVNRDTYLASVLVIVAASFLFLILLTRVLQQNTTDRIENTLYTLRRMEAGDYGLRFEPEKGDEISSIEKGIDGLITQIEDEILQREESEQQLLEAKESADLANQAKSEFLSTMSHEIRTPMNGVLGGLQLLKETPLNQDQAEYTQIIEGSSEAMMYVIDEILDISRLESGQIEIEMNWFKVEDLVKGVMNLFLPEAQKKNVIIHHQNEVDQKHQFKGDVERIRQVLINLVGNAIKFTQQGQILITVSESADTDSADTLLRFEVVDSGIGIQEDKLDSLFESFVQADASITRQYGGSGLGLAISKKLVEIMKGSINVKSQPGEGSRFWFQLPLEQRIQQAPSDIASTPDEDKPNGVRSGQALRILLVEDILPNQLVARKLIERLGHQVDIAVNGVEALQAVNNVFYDLIFMDISMPEMDGVTATRRIRALPGATGQIPIVAMTADATKENVESCMQAGMNDFISKPVSFDKIKEVINGFSGDSNTDIAI